MENISLEWEGDEEWIERDEWMNDAGNWKTVKIE